MDSPLTEKLASRVTWGAGVPRLVREMARYGVVGCTAAASHGLVAGSAVVAVSGHPTASNVVGWLAGFFVSYIGHKRFTSRSKAAHSDVLPRFAVVAMTGLLINLVLFNYVVTVMGVPAPIGIFGAICITPVGVFVSLKLWAFVPRERQTPEVLCALQKSDVEKPWPIIKESGKELGIKAE